MLYLFSVCDYNIIILSDLLNPRTSENRGLKSKFRGNKMSTEQTFTVTVNGIEYDVYTSTRGSNDSFRVTTNNGNFVLTNSWGECNPLRSLWIDWRYQAVHGAARDAMELKCIKSAVEAEVEAHKEFCLQLVEDDLTAEELEAHSRVEAQRQSAIKRIEINEWNRQVQAAAAHQDTEAAHEVAQRLSITGNSVLFDGQEFGWERTAGGSIRIDRALNDAARKSGLRGQAIGELYSMAQKMASAA